MNIAPTNRGVYVLRCDNNKYYCGSTEYLAKRIYSHCHGYLFRGMKDLPLGQNYTQYKTLITFGILILLIQKEIIDMKPLMGDPLAWNVALH